jgi:hypothetical protein
MNSCEASLYLTAFVFAASWKVDVQSVWEAAELLMLSIQQLEA